MHCFRNTGIGLCFIRTKYINITSTSFHAKREWNTSATKLISQWKFLTSIKHRDGASFYYFKWKDDSHNGLFQCNCPKSWRLISGLISPYKQGPSKYSLAGQTFVAGKKHLVTIYRFLWHGGIRKCNIIASQGKNKSLRLIEHHGFTRKEQKSETNQTIRYNCAR